MPVHKPTSITPLSSSSLRATPGIPPSFFHLHLVPPQHRYQAGCTERLEKGAIPRAKMLIERGAEVIVIASCISKGNPIGYPCPHFASLRHAVMKAIGPEIPIIEWTH